MRVVAQGQGSMKFRLKALFGVVGLLHLVGFGLLLLVLAPRYPSVVGLGILAYTFGLRHAFDADHIAAIDNATRKFRQEGRAQVGVGFFFSLGHSTVVAVMALALAASTTTVQRNFPALQSAGSTIGTLVSGSFLYLIGILNLMVAIQIYVVFRQMHRESYYAEHLEEQLLRRGLMNRFVGGLATTVKQSWHMYPIGVLFGLGFDTASEIALLAISAGAVSSGMPIGAITVLPLLFAAGMSLMDTADGAFMSMAYDWAFSKPIRKAYYNLTVTSLSVVVALFVGTVELLQVLTPEIGLSGGVWRTIQTLDFAYLGYIVVGMFATTWATSYLVWRTRRIEERWALAVGTETIGQRSRDTRV